METTWRASYNFLPVLPGERPAWLGDDQVRLRAALDSGEGDPLNPETVCNRIGRCMGVVQLEHAPVQEFILTQEEIDALPAPEWMHTPDGHQYVLGRVGDPPRCAVVHPVRRRNVVSQAWSVSSIAPMRWAVFRRCTCSSFTLAVENRWKELNGDNPIADYLVEIAFPHLEAVHGIKTAPQNIVINGQSLGGLSSLLAVLSRPEAFGGAIAQSSSLWQPQVMDRLDELEAAGD